jgi:hypothetical protein
MKNFEILKEAHSHGFQISKSNLKWSEEKSWNEFLKQNYTGIVKFMSLEERSIEAKKLRSRDMTIRKIAKIMGFKNPGSVTYLLNQKTK